jgi:hypothetical protein
MAPMRCWAHRRRPRNRPSAGWPMGGIAAKPIKQFRPSSDLTSQALRLPCTRLLERVRRRRSDRRAQMLQEPVRHMVTAEWAAALQCPEQFPLLDDPSRSSFAPQLHHPGCHRTATGSDSAPVTQDSHSARQRGPAQLGLGLPHERGEAARTQPCKGRLRALFGRRPFAMANPMSDTSHSRLGV